MYHLAQINIAKMLAPLDDPVMADFVNNLDGINALAEQSHGFVWRFEDDHSEANNAFDEDVFVINMSVWENMDALFKFTYQSDHVEIFKRKKEWFSKMEDMHMVFWYVPIGHIPTPTEAKARLDHLNSHGESPYAFTFKSKYSIEDFIKHEQKTL